MPKGKYNSYVVALIDVLGQKNAFDAMPEFPTTEEDIKKLIAIHKDTVVFLETLRGWITDTVENIAKRPAGADRLPKNKRAKFYRLRKTDVRINTFSDTIIVFASVQGGLESTAGINSIYAILAALTGAILNSFKHKHSIRGAIDIGLGTEHFPNEVYGPALIRPYLDEKHCAKYPRIILGTQLVAFLLVAATEPQTTIDGRVRKLIAGMCFKLIAEDDDGRYFLDFLGKGICDISKGISMEKILPEISEYTKAELERFRSTGDKKLIKRYEKLNRYIESRKRLWKAYRVKGRGDR